MSMTFPWTHIVTVCREIAGEAHHGQKRRGTDEPYFRHPERVADAMSGDPICQCVAYLHDVLEDTPWTEEMLAERGVPMIIISIVKVLTKKPGQSCNDYLAGVRNIKQARRVKIADMLDNLTDQPTAKQIEKYRQGILYLTAI